MFKVDDIDRMILFELDKNSRRSAKEISKILKLNKDTVAYRIKQLEKNGIIKGHYTVIDYSKVGLLLFRIYLKFQNTTLEVEKEIINYLVSLNNTLTVYRTEGDWDLAIGFLVGNHEEFMLVHDKLKEKYKKYIHSERVSFFAELIHMARNYLVNEDLRSDDVIITGKLGKAKYDETDVKILKIVAGHAKTSLLELANKLKLTSMAVSHRIKQLEKKKIILEYRALIDSVKLGYAYYKVDLDLEDITKLKQVREFARHHPNIIFEDRTIGGSDFEFDAELKNYEEFYKLMEEIKKKFPGVIRIYYFYRAREIYKYVYFPE